MRTKTPAPLHGRIQIPAQPGFPWRKIVCVVAVLFIPLLLWVFLSLMPKARSARKTADLKVQHATGKSFLSGKPTSAQGIRVEAEETPHLNGAAPVVIPASTPPAESSDGLDKDALIRQLREDNQRLNAKVKQPPTSPVKTVNPLVPQGMDERRRKQAEEEKEASDAKKSLDVWSAKGDKVKVTELQTLKTPFSLPPTTMIECETERPITNQVPGDFRAYVTRPVRAANGAIVIPGTSTFLMQIAGKSVFGDEWMGIEAEKLVFPDHTFIDLKKGTVGDEHGAAGFKDQIDRRVGTALLGSLTIGALRGGSAIVGGGYGGDASDRVTGAVASETANQGAQQVRQFVRTDPIITIRGRHPCFFMLSEPLELTRAWSTP